MDISVIAKYLTLVSGIVVCLVIIGLAGLITLYCCTNLSGHKTDNAVYTDVEHKGIGEPVYTLPWHHGHTVDIDTPSISTEAEDEQSSSMLPSNDRYI